MRDHRYRQVDSVILGHLQLKKLGIRMEDQVVNLQLATLDLQTYRQITTDHPPHPP